MPTDFLDCSHEMTFSIFWEYRKLSPLPVNTVFNILSINLQIKVSHVLIMFYRRESAMSLFSILNKALVQEYMNQILNR